MKIQFSYFDIYSEVSVPLTFHSEIVVGNILTVTFLTVIVHSFGLGIPRTRNVYIGMSVLLVVTSGNKS